MVTVMRQRAFHKPNGSNEARMKAKGNGGKRLVIFTDIKPFRASGRYKTKTWKQLYAEAPRVQRNAKARKEARKLRQKLANMKMPIPVGRNGNPKKNRYDRRPRYVVWSSEKKNPSPRYRHDGTIW
jgi:hypothetical protein